ncbi:MAG TPA: rhomboid family intramembrane serine protease [Candidatus Paceibacterota bacterium]|nr:rhomboid family intramembrane serine protease [Candidatus Paceibacterota bacterium]
MLEDRDYMRQADGGSNWSATIALLVINVVVFLFQLALPSRLYNPFSFYFELSLDGLKHGFVWQLLTFQVMHDPHNFLHIAFNSLALFFFGRAVEANLGRWRFLQLYFLSGVVGGLVQMLFALLIPAHFDAPVVGASAGVSGLIAAFAAMNWENRFTMFFYFFPVPMRGKTLLWFSVGMAILGVGMGAISSSGRVAHAAHLGGLLAGALFIWLGIGQRSMPWSWRPFDSRKRRRNLINAAVVKTQGWPGGKVISADVPEEEFISKEVDPILDKISEHGIQSLTPREREILERARNKMGKR